MKIKIAGLILIGSMSLAYADQLIESVQQALKDQGFYYGEISGETNANLTAAIRRYQIRNGLQVTGELNSETLHSLGMNSSGSSQHASRAPSPNPPIAPTPNESSSEQSANPNPPAAVQPFGNPSQGQQVYPSTPAGPAVTSENVFSGTPFETAPPPVQRNVMVSAQIALARYGLYHQQIDGLYGPAMEFSLRAFQTQTRLPVSGRLDLQTLAALRLLPGPRHRYYNPYPQRMFPPPARGQWIPD